MSSVRKGAVRAAEGSCPMCLLQAHLLLAAAVQEVQNKGERRGYGLQVSSLSGNLLLRLQLPAPASPRALQSVQSAPEQEEAPRAADPPNLQKPRYPCATASREAGKRDFLPVGTSLSECAFPALPATGAHSGQRKRSVVERVFLLLDGHSGKWDWKRRFTRSSA